MDVLSIVLNSIQYASFVVAVALATVDVLAVAADDNPRPSYARMKTCFVSFVACVVSFIVKKILSLFW